MILHRMNSCSMLSSSFTLRRQQDEEAREGHASSLAGHVFTSLRPTSTLAVLPTACAHLDYPFITAIISIMPSSSSPSLQSSSAGKSSGHSGPKADRTGAAALKSVADLIHAGRGTFTFFGFPPPTGPGSVGCDASCHRDAQADSQRRTSLC